MRVASKRRSRTRLQLLLLPGLGGCSGSAFSFAFLAPLPRAACTTSLQRPATITTGHQGAVGQRYNAQRVGALPGAASDMEEMEESNEGETLSVSRASISTSSQTSPKRRARTDLWNVPNVLTMARVAAIPVFGSVFYLSPVAVPMRNVACASIFALAAATDWLDGYIARRQNIVSAFGAFLDPVADKLMVATALVLLTQRLGPWMAICTATILCREIGVSALREWMAQIGARDAVKVGMAGKVKTATTMVALTLLLLLQPGPACLQTILPRDVWLPPSQALLCVSTVLTITSASGYLRAAWPALMGDEPLPPVKLD